MRARGVEEAQEELTFVPRGAVALANAGRARIVQRRTPTANLLWPSPKDVMRNTGLDAAKAVQIPSDPAAARQLQDEIEQALIAQQFPERDIFCIKLALEEALVNAIKHGNQAERGKQVRVSYRVDHQRFAVDIQDEGPGFDPCDVPDPLNIENLERPCGRGLLLMRHYMSDVIFHPPGNRVSMTKVRTEPSQNGHA